MSSFEAVSLGGSNLYSNEEMKKVQFANGALQKPDSQD
jgi:zinc protease